jgi:HPt (histidine-containing phosphotransfer) domain-containing protein
LSRRKSCPQRGAIPLVIIPLFGYTVRAGGFLMADNTAYVDIADGAKRVMNNTKLYIKLLTKFRDGTNLNDLEAALAEGDLKKAQDAAHTVKGVSANLSLPELFKQCLELENQIKAADVKPAQVETVKTVFNATLQEINRIISENV